MGGTRTQRFWRRAQRWLAVAGPIAAGNALIWLTAGTPLMLLGIALVAAGGIAWDSMLHAAFREGYDRGASDALRGAMQAAQQALAVRIIESHAPPPDAPTLENGGGKGKGAA